MRLRPSRLQEALLVLALALPVSPVAALDPTRPLRAYSLDFYRDGLPQSTVRTILQTSDGYLWLGTFEGLVRFDGTRFDVFDDGNVPEVPTWRVGRLCEHPAGTLWIGLSGGGLVRRVAGTFTAFGTDDGLPSTTVVGLVVRRDGSLWVATDSGLARWGGARFEPIRIPSLPMPVRAMVEGLDGKLVVAAGRELLRLGEGADAPPVAIPLAGESGPPQVESLDVGRDGSLLAGSTNDGFYLVRGRDVERYDSSRGLPAPLVKGALEDRDGSIWVATTPGGLVRIRDGRVEVLDRGHGLPSSSLRSLFEDREGSLWVGTDQGLARLKDLKLVSYGVRQGLPEDNVRTVVEAADGAWWAGINGGGLVRVDPVTGEVSPPVTGLERAFVRTLAFGADGALWVGTGDGLFRLRGGRLANAGEELGLSGVKLDALYFLRDGALLAVTSEAGLQEYRGARFEPVSATLPKDIRVILEDRGGTLWLGTSEHGLLETREGRVRRAYTARDGLASDTVFALSEVSDGELWIGTHDGLSRLRGGRLASVTAGNGLPEDTVFQVLDDRRGSIWLTTNRGLVRADRSSLEAVWDGRAARVSAEVFGKADGLGADQCNGNTQPAGLVTRDGRLAIPTAGGLTIVDPVRLHRNTVSPRVLLTGFFVDGRPVSDGTRLPWSAQRFEARYDGLSLLQPERVTFRYRIDGLDPGWVDAGGRRSAFYNSLPPGRHRFRVEACNNDGVWSESAATVRFEIPAPPWRRWWALTAYVLLALGGLAASGRLYARLLRRRNELLERRVEERTAELNETLHRLEASEARAVEASRAKTVFLANMSHELRTPLNAVLGFAQLLARDARLTQQNREELGIIHRSGEHLLGLINDVLSLTRIETGRLTREERPFDVRETLRAVEDIARVKAEAKGLDLRFAVEGSPPQSVTGDEGKLRQVLINLVGNAVKFTTRGSVTLHASWKEGRASFEVSDTGPGMTEEELGRLFTPFSQAEQGRRASEGAGLGLAISRQIVGLLGGEIRVESRIGEGTTFSFFVELPASERAVEPHVSRRVVGLQPGQPPPRILVADDTPENRLLLRRLLGGLGFDVREAENGEKALEEWERFHPALVLMDMRMPVLDGREATRRIRLLEEGRGSRTVIVSLTASALEHERSELLAGGADEVVTKPFRIDALLEVLERRLGVRYLYEGEASTGEGPRPPSEEGTGRAPLALAGVDVEAGLRRSSGDEALYRDLLRGFLEDLEKRVSELAGPLEGASGQRLRPLLHRLKGNAATLGARRVARAAAALESSVVSGEPREEERTELLAAIAEVVAGKALVAVVAAEGGAEGAESPLAIAQRLEARLATNDLAAVEDLEKLRAALPRPASLDLSDLVRCMDQLDFEGASRALSDLRQRL